MFGLSLIVSVRLVFSGLKAISVAIVPSALSTLRAVEANSASTGSFWRMVSSGLTVASGDEPILCSSSSTAIA